MRLDPRNRRQTVQSGPQSRRNHTPPNQGRFHRRRGLQLRRSHMLLQAGQFRQRQTARTIQQRNNRARLRQDQRLSDGQLPHRPIPRRHREPKIRQRGENPLAPRPSGPRRHRMLPGPPHQRSRATQRPGRLPVRRNRDHLHRHTSLLISRSHRRNARQHLRRSNMSPLPGRRSLMTKSSRKNLNRDSLVGAS